MKFRLKTLAFLCCITIISINNFAQQPDTLINKTDSLRNHTDSTKLQKIVTDSSVCRRISFPDYFILLSDDLKQDVNAPFHQTCKTWMHIGIYAASLTAFSVALDEPIQQWASNIRDNSKTVSDISGFVTKFGGPYELYTLGAVGSCGFLFHDKKLQTTTLLATQAYITSGLLETVLKDLTGRQRPSYFDSHEPDPEPAFHGPAFSFGDNIYKQQISTAFPSGHATVAFAVATVFAKEYRNTTWVPVVAYSVASLVGLSRITQNAHWATDVIAGATLGYLCGTQVVNNYHRYALKASREKGTVSFNLNYNGYNFEPGLVYTFR